MASSHAHCAPPSPRTSRDGRSPQPPHKHAPNAATTSGSSLIALELVIIGQVLVEEEALIHAIQVRHIHRRGAAFWVR